MKVITIVGTVGKDSEIRQNARGEFITFSVAVSKGYSRDAGADWFQVSYYNTKMAQYLTKGKKIVASGNLDIVEKEGRTYHNIYANQIEFASPPKSNDSDDRNSQLNDRADDADNIDEIPF